jgi:hypothetical protein
MLHAWAIEDTSTGYLTFEIYTYAWKVLHAWAVEDTSTGYLTYEIHMPDKCYKHGRPRIPVLDTLPMRYICPRNATSMGDRGYQYWIPYLWNTYAREMLQAWAIEDTSTGYLTYEIHMPEKCYKHGRLRIPVLDTLHMRYICLNNATSMGDRGYQYWIPYIWDTYAWIMLQAWAIEDTSTGYLIYEIHMPEKCYKHGRLRIPVLDTLHMRYICLNNATSMGDRGYQYWIPYIWDTYAWEMLQAWAIEDTSTGYLTYEIHMPE